MGMLEEVRKAIDQYDEQIVKLFELRMEKSIEALRFKQERGLTILQNDRENEVIEKVKSQLTNKALEPEIDQLYRTMMKLSRQIQAREWNLSDFLLIGDLIVLPLGERIENKMIAFQGEPGAFGHKALIHYFGTLDKVKHFDRFKEVFQAVQNGIVDYGVLPIANSSTGSVNEIYDLLLDYDIYIVGEQVIKIEHNLAGLADTQLDKVTEVYSHYQGISQCKNFLNHFPHWKHVYLENTAASAKYIKETNDPTKVAIASKAACELYGLKILKENIQTSDENWTKFIIIGKKVEINKNSKKISLVFSLRHNVGSLYESLGFFVRQGINLEKVESRPILNQPWKYHFFVDIEGNLFDKQVQDAITKIQEKSLNIKILGNY